VSPPISIRDLVGTWTKPIGELIYFHQGIDLELVDLIWLMQAREGALSRNRRNTRRTNPPPCQGGERIRQFEALAKRNFDELACFVDPEARATIDRLVDQLKNANTFRNQIVHGRWAGSSNGQLTLFDAREGRWVYITPELLEDRGREAWELIHSLREFHVWVTMQNAEVTRRQSQRAMLRLLRIRILRSRPPTVP
jgi:hypothetical protein